MRVPWPLPLVLASMVALALAPAVLRPAPAAAFQAPCTGPTEDDAAVLVSVTEPAGGSPIVSGPPPLAVGITIASGIVSFPAGLLTSTLLWGDGSSAPVATRPCGDDEYEFTGQTLRHVFSEAGFFTVTWELVITGLGPFSIPLAFVTVEQAPPPTQAASPTATSTPVPATAVPTGGASPSPAGPSPTLPAATSPTGSPRPASPTTGPSPAATATSGASASPSPAPGSTGSTPGLRGEQATPTPARPEGLPEIAAVVDGPGDVSTDPGVIVTNLVIAGFTVWVFFSSAFLDQVLADRRSTLESRIAPLGRPFRRLRGRARPGPGLSPRLRVWVEVGGVLLLVGAIDTFLEPGFGLDRATAVLFVSAMVGIGLLTFVCDGLEALATRRWASTPAGVRAYPAAIGIAVASVVVSRALDLSPGVIYGFVASAVALGPMATDRRMEGRLASIPLVSALLLAVFAWFALEPVRALESDGFVALVAESALVVVLIGGVEGAAISLLPVAVTDGGKVYRWSRATWAVLVMVSAFLAWHVLFGREREYFSGFQEAQSLVVVALFAGYSALSVGAWLWLRRG